MGINKIPKPENKTTQESRSIFNDLYVAKLFFVFRDTPNGPRIVSVLDELPKEKRRD